MVKTASAENRVPRRPMSSTGGPGLGAFRPQRPTTATDRPGRRRGKGGNHRVAPAWKFRLRQRHSTGPSTHRHLGTAGVRWPSGSFRVVARTKSRCLPWEPLVATINPTRALFNDCRLPETGHGLSASYRSRRAAGTGNETHARADIGRWAELTDRQGWQAGAVIRKAFVRFGRDGA